MIALLLPLAWGKSEPARPDLDDPKVRLQTQVEVLDALIAGGMPEQAMAMVTQMHEQGVRDPRVDVAQARAMDLVGMDAEARRILEDVVRRHPRNGPAWAALGLVRADAGDSAGAVAALTRAARFMRQDAKVLNNLGFARMATGDARGAAEVLQKAVQLAPTDPTTRNNLGFALARLERDDEALQLFLAATGSEADARYNLGVACAQRGDRAGAMTNWQAALAAQPEHALAQKALANTISPPEALP
jgi:Flp pilus assembly protein TadD